MKNPLTKRLARELKGEFGKYLVIFLLMLGSIGFVSGFLVADGSMLIAYEESFEKYNIEDGNFRLEKEANRAQKKTIQEFKVALYDNFYTEEALTNGSILRIFKNREQVNRVCLMEGKMPAADDEIVIDRMYADNNHIEAGDTVTSQKRSWKVTGLVALSDYSCLFSNNNDTMFDSVKFGVGIVAEEGFAEFKKEELFYSYSWKYLNEPADELHEKEMSDDLMKVVSGETRLEDFVPRYLNQAIQFTGDDMGSDRAMMLALLYIVITIMAFVFGITVSNTISREANVIGTLRASGYTRGELIRHYMAMPILVTVIGAVIGNLLGYTVFKGICVNMYYGSYSLPTYVTKWNGEAFLLTTVVPLILMTVVNVIVLGRKLTLSPLKFLRRDLSRKKQKRAVPLSFRIPFFSRFRLRVVLQNMSNYAVLFVGIVFANLLLMFGLVFPSVLDHYQEEIEDNLLSNYQYLLQVPLNVGDDDHKLESLMTLMYFQYLTETENEDAEKFSAYSLNTLGEKYKSEEILLYGLIPESRYIPLEFEDSEVFISSAYSDKYDVKPGDAIRLKEAYEDTVYEFHVSGIYDYEGGLAVFMDQKLLNRTFELGEEYFGGYFSDTEITDINDKYIASVIDLESLTKISRQLDVSMGSMMTLVDAFAVVMFMILIYLLSKIIIEKNAQSISMAKILGYTNGEISRLYIVSTSMVVVTFLLISLPIEYWIMVFMFRAIMMSSISGWIPFYVDAVIYIKMLAMGIVTYAVVAALEYRRVRRVPMDEALKNVE
ncbi:ABC transporter permease [Ruminococcus gauvreauii]|uniref:ABC transporter permease n=1 Tax=Ruminococcus gauvreauii TaxID=438033 RepID=A0ABY5VGQ3_9FIRM|nr:ABC transporter permease [Ruminococcus gauvreauii]UWP59353.1 ABC transporter permease [Ruminococcus gauvreauii]